MCRILSLCTHFQLANVFVHHSELTFRWILIVGIIAILARNISIPIEAIIFVACCKNVGIIAVKIIVVTIFRRRGCSLIRIYRLRIGNEIVGYFDSLTTFLSIKPHIEDAFTIGAIHTIINRVLCDINLWNGVAKAVRSIIIAYEITLSSAIIDNVVVDVQALYIAFSSVKEVASITNDVVDE